MELFRLTRTGCISCLLCLAISAPVLAQNPILFNGGIGIDEREQAPDRGTRLVFFVSSGSFLADVAVTVKNEAGELLVDTRTLGPWLILDLPPGRYQVDASIEGQQQGAMIDVSGERQEFSFMFKAR